MASLLLKFRAFQDASARDNTRGSACKRPEAISLHEEVLRERGEPLPEDRVELVEVAA